jgi:hypothetical protein
MGLACVRCNQETVYASPDGATFGKAGIHVRNLGEMMVVPTPLDSFVCTTCGFVENRIRDAGKLTKIKEHWQQA